MNLFYFLHCIICLCRNTKFLWLNINDHQQWIWSVTAHPCFVPVSLVNSNKKREPLTTQTLQQHAALTKMVLTRGKAHVCQGHLLGVLAQCYTTLPHAPWLLQNQQHKSFKWILQSTVFSSSLQQSSQSPIMLQHCVWEAKKLPRQVVIISTIDPLEHVKHDFVIVVVQKPNAGILIIFLEWNCTPQDASEKTGRKKSMENTLSSRGKP